MMFRMMLAATLAVVSMVALADARIQSAPVPISHIPYSAQNPGLELVTPALPMVLPLPGGGAIGYVLHSQPIPWLLFLDAGVDSRALSGDGIIVTGEETGQPCALARGQIRWICAVWESRIWIDGAVLFATPGAASVFNASLQCGSCEREVVTEP